MTDFKIRGRCLGCKRKRWFVRKRQVKLPIGLIATSKDLMCTTCYRKLIDNLSKNERPTDSKGDEQNSVGPKRQPRRHKPSKAKRR